MKSLAKKPEQRQTNALALAVEAEGLMQAPRRLTTGTRVMPQVIADETTVLEKVKRDPNTTIVWPWIAVISLLIVTAVTLLVAMIIGSNQPGSKPTSSSTPTTSQTQSAEPTPSASPTKIVLMLGDVAGLNVTDVSTQLNALGLKVIPVAGDQLPAGDERIQTVYDAKPLGSLMPGDEITVYYYVQKPEPSASPTPTVTQSPVPTPSPTQ
jgi:serine/threonine-protein kinase